ncbi:MAG TPA: GDP-mannose 4,6-dehydratase [Geobacteraceae bacterium]
MRILVTGGAGFIGSHLSERLLARGHDVVVIDNFNDFYDPALKRRNVLEIAQAADRHNRDFVVCEGDIRDGDFVHAIFAREAPEAVVHLAAAAGVRPSIERPLYYEEVNVRGTMQLLEAARTAGVRPFLFASSSSVYGNSPKVPFSEADPVDTPISPYAATKKSAELICYTYHHLHAMSITCLRFFTVYGPRQRPDLAISKFTRLIDEGKPIPFFGDGTTSRDYTFVTDIVEGVEKALSSLCGGEPSFSLYNLGGSRPVELSRLVTLIEEALGKKAVMERLPAQPGDVCRTWADLTRAEAGLGYRPATSIEEGIKAFVGWYQKNRH